MVTVNKIWKDRKKERKERGGRKWRAGRTMEGRKEQRKEIKKENLTSGAEKMEK